MAYSPSAESNKHLASKGLQEMHAAQEALSCIDLLRNEIACHMVNDPSPEHLCLDVHVVYPRKGC